MRVGCYDQRVYMPLCSGDKNGGGSEQVKVDSEAPATPRKRARPKSQSGNAAAEKVEAKAPPRLPNSCGRVSGAHREPVEEAPIPEVVTAGRLVGKELAGLDIVLPSEPAAQEPPTTAEPPSKPTPVVVNTPLPKPAVESPPKPAPTVKASPPAVAKRKKPKATTSVVKPAKSYK